MKSVQQWKEGYISCEGYESISKHQLGGTTENNENSSQNTSCPGKENSDFHGFLQFFHSGYYLN
jgi:hypothetical protein